MEQSEDGPDMELGQLGSGPVVEIESAGDHADQNSLKIFVFIISNSQNASLN